MCGQKEQTNQELLELSKKELVVLFASVARYITYLTRSNNRVLRALGYENSLIDCEDKILLIKKAEIIQEKIIEKMKL